MAVKVFSVLIPVVGILYITNVPFYLGMSIYRMQYVAVFVTLSTILTFLAVKPTRRSAPDRVPFYDIICALASLAMGGYVAIYYPTLIIYMATISTTNVILGIVAIVLMLEATRRLVGSTVMILAAIFTIYPFVSHLLPGILNTRPLVWQRVVTFFYLNPDGLFGVPAGVVSTIVLAYMIFGAFLFITGGGQFLTDFAMAAVGKYRGGPAKVSVLSSGLFGMIAGSPSAIAATIGVITIPMMKKAGYSSTFAGALQATAATAGTICPPVMSAVAFLIAEFLQMPYAQVALAAAVPAFLYYVALYAQVDLEAPKTGIKGLPREALPSLRKSIKEGWFFIIPLIVLVICLFTLTLSAELSALFATASVVAVACLSRKTRAGLARFVHILENTGRGMLEIGIVSAVAGLIVGAITVTGLGITFSMSLATMAGGNVFLLLLLAAVACIILGMGMPIIAVYIVVVILIGPALIQLGIPPLAAHLFVLYFGAMSFITPPVCIAVYVTAAIAKSGSMRTGFLATRLSIAAYLVPFVFAFSPALLLLGTPLEFIMVFIPTTLGIILIAISLAGYLFRPLNAAERVWAGAAGLALLIPNYLNLKINGIDLPLGLVINGIGLALGILFYLRHRRKVRATRLADVPVTANSEAETINDRLKEGGSK